MSIAIRVLSEIQVVSFSFFIFQFSSLAMVTKFFSFGFLVLFLGLINSGDGIRCWECNSERDYNCRDPFNFTHFPLVDCDRKAAHNTYLQSYSVCRKTVQRVNGELQVERSCAWEQVYDGNRPCSSSRSSPYSTVEHCSTCNTDACNSATPLKNVGALPILAVLYLGAKVI